MAPDVDHRPRHSAHPTPTRADWARPTSPQTAAVIAFVGVTLVTVGIVAGRPDMTGSSRAVLSAYAATIAVLASILAANMARHRAALRSSNAKALAEAVEREERLRLIVASMHEGLIFRDRDQRLVEYNDAASNVLGITDMALYRTPEEMGPWHPVLEDGTILSFDDHPAAVTLRTGDPTIGMTLGVALTGGHTIWLKLNTIPVFDGDEVDGVITTFTDITTARTAATALASSEAAANVATAALSWQTFHDPLTKLPNRAQLVERLTASLDRVSRQGGLTAVLVIDLDRFKNVNDTMGHEAGDLLLVEIADRLRGAIRASDMVARLAGDEFIVLADSLADRAEALAMADRLRSVVSQPVGLPQGIVTVTASMGIAFDTDHRPSTLLRDADTALHKSKEQGRDSLAIFDDSLRGETIRRVAAEQLLRRALDEDGLRVLYQPIVDLSTGEIVGAEALLRILGPHGELLTPSSFVSIAEDTGLIVPVGAGVLDHACQQLVEWRWELGDAAPDYVSVNLSARQITTRHFPSVVARTLAQHGVDPSCLTLELTETTLIEAGHAALDTVEELHDLGVRLAIDDFGTGYSSLSYLKRFPVDIVKVDRSFIAGLGKQQHDTEIVRAVLALGQSLGLTTVAEGVETSEQLQMLQDLGCDAAQGFLLARPIEGAAVGATSDHIRGAVLSDRPVQQPTLRLAGG